jgi:hypothetical protein
MHLKEAVSQRYVELQQNKAQEAEATRLEQLATAQARASAILELLEKQLTPTQLRTLGAYADINHAAPYESKVVFPYENRILVVTAEDLSTCNERLIIHDSYLGIRGPRVRPSRDGNVWQEIICAASKAPGRRPSGSADAPVRIFKTESVKALVTQLHALVRTLGNPLLEVIGAPSSPKIVFQGVTQVNYWVAKGWIGCYLLFPTTAEVELLKSRLRNSPDLKQMPHRMTIRLAGDSDLAALLEIVAARAGMPPTQEDEGEASRRPPFRGTWRTFNARG